MKRISFYDSVIEALFEHFPVGSLLLDKVRNPAVQIVRFSICRFVRAVGFLEPLESRKTFPDILTTLPHLNTNVL